MIDLTTEFQLALLSPDVRRAVTELVREAVRGEIQSASILDELLDVAQAAKVLGMSACAVSKAVQRGDLQVTRIGRRLRFRRSDLLNVGKGRTR